VTVERVGGERGGLPGRGGGRGALQLPPPRLPPALPAHCRAPPPVPNGEMVCKDQRTSTKCSPVCKTGHAFYQKFSSRPPTYLCSAHRVDWRITKFIPDCSPVERPGRAGCRAGWEARGGRCLACPPGMFRKSAPLCQLCGKGSYAEGFGSSRCYSCPALSSTPSLGTRKKSDCRAGRTGGRGGGRARPRRPGTGLTHYNSWLAEQPYRSSRP